MDAADPNESDPIETDPIEIVEYDPAWVAAFESEAALLMDALGGLVVEIVHVGSTAVPGLAAKPVIDIQVGVTSLDSDDELIAAVVSCGYDYIEQHEEEFPERRYFRRTERGRHIHHVHVVERSNAAWWDRHVALRDWLRAHPNDRDAYAELKRDLAVRYRNDRVAYTNAKSEFIAAALDKAGQR